MADTRQHWRVVPGQSLQRHEWDDEAVLFNDLSGSTHLLSSVAMWLLDRLHAGPADAAALAHALGAELMAESDADPQGVADVDPALLDDLLGQLHHMHLIEQC